MSPNSRKGDFKITSTENLSEIIFYGVAMAMGVAGLVLSFVDGLNRDSLTLYGIAIFALAIVGLNKATKKDAEK